MGNVTREHGFHFGATGCRGLAGTVAAALALWVLPGALFAAPVSPDQAEAAVRRWVSRNPKPLSAVIGQTAKRAKAFTDPANQALFYVVPLAEGGFVVTSCDTKIEPIIAFSSAEEFVSTPENPLYSILMYDLGGRKRRAGPDFAGAAHSAPGVSEPERQWASLLEEKPCVELASVTTVGDLRVAPLVLTKWGQSIVGNKAVYNYYTPNGPDGSSNNYVCGCVATAMAQLMKFHGYPTASVAPATVECWVGDVPRSLTMKGGVYAWSDMPNVPATSITDTQRQAIGKLCYDAGVSVAMQYDYGGSGAYTGDVAPALKTYFGYPSAVNAGDYSTGVSNDAVQKSILVNLDCGYPVQLAISGSSGGHSVLADGYGYSHSTLYFHINMGWGGYQDVWYTLPNMGNDIGFTSLNLVCYNVFPDSEKKLVSGRVLKANGVPAAGASVTVRNSSGALLATRTTNAKGMYAYAMNGASASETLTLQAAEGDTASAEKNVTLQRSTDSKPGNLWGQDLTLSVPDGSYLVSVAADPAAFGSVAGGEIYAGGASCTVTAEPNSGYSFVNWTEGGAVVGTSPSYTFTVTATRVLTAHFEVEKIPLGAALNTTGLAWTTSPGGAGWYGQKIVSHDAAGAACSGAVGDGQESVMQTTVTGPGNIAFFWKVSSEQDRDHLKFFIDGAEQPGSISGETEWSKQTFTIENDGTHTLEWVYAKNGSTSEGSDCGWVDQVVWTSTLPYTVTTASSPASGGSTTGGGTFTGGSSRVVTAMAGSGYTFVNWKNAAGNVVSTSTTYVFMLDADLSLTACFVPTGVSLQAALDNTALAFTSTGSSAGWFGQTAVKTHGASAAQSGPIGHGQSSVMQATVTGPIMLSFWWKASSEPEHDALKLYIDGAAQPGSVSGVTEWENKSLTIPAGTHTVQWVYSKNSTGSAGSDCAWVDQVALSPVILSHYTVTFAAAGGSPASQNISVPYNGNYILPADPVREGYAFAGWFTAAVNGSQVTTATLMNKTADHTLHARWTAEKYTVAFDAQGATNPAPKPVTYGSAYGALPAPTRAMCTLDGWYTEPYGGGVKITSATVVSRAANHTLYASWFGNPYTVSYNANGGTPANQSQTVIYAKPYVLPTEPVRTGYTFTGWFTARSGGTKITADTIVALTASQELYAQWVVSKYTVGFDGQGAPDPAAKTVAFGEAYGAALPKITRTGYAFDAWYTQPSGGGVKVLPATVITVNANHTLYANWIPNTYAVACDANGGAPAKQTVLATYGQPYALPPAPVRAGYRFTGWFTAKTGGVKIAADATVAITAGQTLFAQWIVYVETYEVLFDAQGGTVSPAAKEVSESYPYGELPVPTRSDYAFLGWYTEPDGAGVRVSAAAVATQSESHTLYAKWIYGVIPVTFAGNGGEPATQSETQMYGTRYTLPAPPVREGHTFLGWFADRGGTGAPLTASATVSETTAFYAKWAPAGALPTVYAIADGPGAITLSPANGQVVKGKPVTLTAKPAKDALFVDWSNGETTASIKAAPEADTVYVARFRLKTDCRDPVIEAITPADNRMVGVPFEMQVCINDAAKPVKFTASGLPAGLKINAATGLISGVPSKIGAFDNVNIKVASVANAKKTASVTLPAITIEALPWNAQGIFSGLVRDADYGAFGSFTATISAAGKVTAKVVSTNGTWSLTAPSWSEREGDLFCAAMKTAKGQTLEIQLDAGTPWNEANMFCEISGGCCAFAQRNPFANAKDESYAEARAALGAYTGYYTLALGGTEVEGSTGEARNIPQGHGYLTATVDAKGSVKYSGKLPDGAAVSGSATFAAIGAGGAIPCFTALYGAKGFLGGDLCLNAEGAVETGLFDWFYPGKTPAGKAPATEDRFAMILSAQGGLYDKTAALSDYYADKRFATEDCLVGLEADGKGGIKLPKGKAPFYNKATGEVEYDPENPHAVTLTLTKATGLFTGKFSLYEEIESGAAIKIKTASISHQGVLLHKPEPCGLGFYQISETWKSGGASYPLKRSYPVSIE